jgi:serine/threonine protein kinase
MATKAELVPDQQIIAAITGLSLPESQVYHIVSNTFTTCTFRLKLEKECPKGYPADLMVRLEDSKGRLAQVAAFQRLGRLQLPDVVLEILHVDVINDAGGRELEYAVSPYVEGTSTLEDIWDSIPLDNQQDIMDSIVDAIGKLHSLDMGSEDVRRQLLQLRPARDSGKPVEPLIGGPSIEYHADIRQLLEAFAGGVGGETEGYEIEQLQSGIAVRSTLADIGTLELNQADLDALKQSVALCHNDLEPRNILVRKDRLGSDGNNARYHVAAIIDWEMAGFYPIAYEFGFKDTALGSSNLYFGWYSLFRERAARLVPDGACHSKLIKAMTIIGRSKTRARKRNVGCQFQQKWAKRQRVMLADEKRGWILEDGADNRVFTKEDNDNLENEVLQELGYL